jgi:undecaprenyl-diphosphatase
VTAPSPNYFPGSEPVERPTLFEETVALISLATAALSLFLFSWIAESVAHEHTQNFDRMVRNQVHRYAAPGMTKAMVAISFLGGDGLVLAAIVSLVVFLWLRRRRAALWLLVTLAGALVLDLTLKYAFHRARPTPFFGPLPRTYSFPSGHSLFSFCFYGVLAGLLAGRIRSLPLRIVIWTSAALLVLAIGLSRVYLGVHYPSDVIAGYLTGTIWVATMVFLDRWRAHRKKNNLDRVLAILLVGGAALGAVRMDANPKYFLNPFGAYRALGTSRSLPEARKPPSLCPRTRSRPFVAKLQAGSGQSTFS